MIGFLSGKVHLKLLDSIILLVNGIGYRILVPSSTYASILPQSPLELHIHSHIREDCFDLYGFKTSEELSLFNLLLSVSGIGPKTALLVIDRGVEKTKTAIIKADVDFFTLIPRLGRKNSQKIIIELKNKLGSLIELDLAAESGETQDAAEALKSMGYTKQEALSALKNMPESEETLEQKIRYALKNIGRKKQF